MGHSTASRFVTRARQAGMVTRSSSSRDARQILVAPTPAGRAFMSSSDDYRLTQLAAIVGGWGDGEVRDLAGLLTRFAAAAVSPAP